VDRPVLGTPSMALDAFDPSQIGQPRLRADVSGSFTKPRRSIG